MGDTDENLYRVSYILTENSQFQCPVCFEEFLHEDAVQQHMAHYNHYEATTVFIKTEKDDSEDELQTETDAQEQEIDESLLEEKIQNQVIHALSNIEKLTHQIVQQEYIEDDSNSTDDISGHLQVELKTDVEMIEQAGDSRKGRAAKRSKSKDGVPGKRPKLVDYTCELCPTKYPKRHLLKLHMKEHEGDMNYSCDVCKKTFTFRHQLNTHRKCHTLERKFKCLTCEKSYKFKQQLNLHVLTHSGIKPYICETCQKCFTLERQLQSHLKVHTSIKPFVCAQCGKCFKIKQQLQNHELTHYDIKPFVCELCNKAFKLKQQLQNHQKVHEDSKPYPCDQCGKSFKFKQQLQNHGKIHDGVKQFPCEFCEKEFMFKQQLQIHMKIHFGIKEFPCHLCPKDFRTKQQLQKHLEMHERKLLRLSDRSDDGMSEISTLSTAENDSEFGVDNIPNENSSSIAFPEILLTPNKSIVQQQKFIILKRSEIERQALLQKQMSENNELKMKLQIEVPKPVEEELEVLEAPKEEIKEEEEEEDEVQQEPEVLPDPEVLPEPSVGRSVIVETIETCIIENREDNNDGISLDEVDEEPECEYEGEDSS